VAQVNETRRRLLRRNLLIAGLFVWSLGVFLTYPREHINGGFGGALIASAPSLILFIVAIRNPSWPNVLAKLVGGLAGFGFYWAASRGIERGDCLGDGQCSLGILNGFIIELPVFLAVRYLVGLIERSTARHD